MRLHPLQRFFGVDPHAPPHVLLGLAEATRDRVVVEEALRDRLDQLFRHPAGRSADAETVRETLRDAARALCAAPDEREQAVRRARSRSLRATPVPPPRVRRAAQQLAATRELTGFDRLVWAVLVSHGGWNARSRALLVGLADAHGVTADGLVRVIGGLNDYARSGGRHEPIAPAELPPPSTAFGGGPAPMLTEDQEQRIKAAVSAELTRDPLHRTVTLSALFGLVTILLGILLVRAVMDDSRAGRPPAPAPRVERPAPLVADTPRPPAPSPVQGPEGTARFDRLPTFLGNALPVAATEAADAAPRIPEHLDDVIHRLAVSSDPSEAVFRSWETSIATIETGWVLVEDSVRTAIERRIAAALFEVGDASKVADRLLVPILPPTDRLGAPLDVWRGAWRAGMLGVLRADTGLPPVVRERVEAQLGVALHQAPELGADVDPFRAHALAWLEQTIGPLVELTPFEDRYDDFWESWLTAVSELDMGETRQRLVGAVVSAVLATSTDLARPGPMVDVLGRFLATGDYEASESFRAAFVATFDDRDRIKTQDLWVMTSILSRPDIVVWFDESLVLPADASPSFRSRVRDRVIERWPAIARDTASAPGGRGLEVDPRAAAKWYEAYRGLVADRGPRDIDGMMAALVTMSRLNEAAALLASYRDAEAEDVIARIAARASRPAPAAAPPPGSGVTNRGGGGGRRGGPGSGPRVGQAVGADGAWAEQYEAVRRNTAEKLKWLRTLRTTAGTDLGPIDAEVFVREVYRGSPQEVRSLASAILVQHFGTGPNVAIEMLDQLPDAPRRSDAVADAVQRLTGRVLTAVDSPSWWQDARLALAEHVLSMRPGGASPVDTLAGELADSLHGRHETLAREASDIAAAPTPQEAAELLADAWRERIDTVIAREPTPADLGGLDRRRLTRRRLAEGPIQSMVADEIAVLDALTYITVAEQPRVRDRAIAILEDAAERRRAAKQVLQQALAVEQAIARMWALRMAIDGNGRGAGEEQRP